MNFIHIIDYDADQRNFGYVFIEAKPLIKASLNHSFVTLYSSLTWVYFVTRLDKMIILKKLSDCLILKLIVCQMLFELQSINHSSKKEGQGSYGESLTSSRLKPILIASHGKQYL